MAIYWREVADTGLYHKACMAFEAGLTHDPENEELKGGLRRASDAFDMQPVGVEMQERVARAVADPGLRAITTDPVIRQLLSQCPSDPLAVAAYLRNAGVAAAKVQKLVDAGLLMPLK